MTAERPLSVYLIAGEASGDLLGAHLMRALKSQSPRPLLFSGIGGEKMTAEGLQSLFPFYELSMMGFVEVLPYVFNLAARIQATVEDILAKQPDVIVTIDSPGFCTRVVEKLRREKLKSRFIHYVAPTVWVYKPERAAKFARLFDHLLCLLPFEPPYFEKEGLKSTWVGHPVVVEAENGNAEAFRQKYELPAGTPLLALLPGSRKGEVDRHMPIFARAVTMLSSKLPDLVIAVAVPRNVLNFIMPYFQNCPFRAIVMANEQEKKNAIAASTLAISKSGTVALEVAKAGTPLITAHRVHPLSAWWLRRMTEAKYVNLINIIHNQEVVPELLQERCAPLFIANAAGHLLSDPANRQRQHDLAAAALAQLTPPDGEKPSDIAARTILSLAL